MSVFAFGEIWLRSVICLIVDCSAGQSFVC